MRSCAVLYANAHAQLVQVTLCVGSCAYAAVTDIGARCWFECWCWRSIYALRVVRAVWLLARCGVSVCVCDACWCVCARIASSITSAVRCALLARWQRYGKTIDMCFFRVSFYARAMHTVLKNFAAHTQRNRKKRINLIAESINRAQRRRRWHV